MQKRKFTTVTQLHEKNNAGIIAYIENSRSDYAQAVRETFHTIKNAVDFNKSGHNTYLQDKYGIMKRTANSIISDAQGKLNALKELKLHEKQVLERKIAWFEEKVIPELQAEKEKNCAKLRAGFYVNLIKHRNLKRKLVAKKAKFNRMKQKFANLIYQIETGRYKLCFGTKRLLQRNYDQFVEQRDSQVSFVGARDEKACNQNLQLSYNPFNNQFNIRLRKDFGEFKSAKGNDKLAFGKVYFNHHKNEIIQILAKKNSPLSYKVIKEKGRYYLHCTFEIQVDEEYLLTRNSYGTIGLDFNKGFVTLSETNRYGHLVQTQFLPYRFKSGNKTKTDLQRIANYVVSLALMVGKDICIENLNFKATKAKTESKRGKKYNEMIHSLAYRQFVDTIESVAYRNLVTVSRVNPAWTSWLAAQLYCPTMKLNTHVGASFVIARRGQGYRDTI